MTWIPVPTANGQQWQVNQDGLYLMARASARASLARRYTREIRSGEGWFDGPPLVEIETDWRKVNRETEQASQTLYHALAREVMNHPENSARNFVHMVAETRMNQEHIRALQRRSMSGNMANISRHVNNWENAVEVTRFIRDTAWTTLVVLSAIPTGGASTGAAALSSGVRVTALAAGSAGRGQATYQDTGHVGAAVINGAGSFITGAIGLPPGPGMVLSGGEQAILLGIQSTSAGGFAGLQGLAEGNSGETAAWQAVSAAGFNAAGGMMSGSQTLSNMSLPVQVIVQVATDMTGGRVDSAISVPSNGLATPRTSGRLTHGGIPTHPSRDASFVQETVLRAP